MMKPRALVSTLRTRVPSALARRFGVDARALAALRISLGVLLLADLLVRSRDLVAFYTDDGVLPRAVLFDAFPGLGSVSVHAFSGAAWFQILLFLVAGAVAVALLLGYRTRFVTIASLVLLVSLHARNPVLLNGGDSLLRRLLFWGAFLPLGATWSVDALRRGESGHRIASMASAALLLQVVVVYTVNGVFKLRGDLWLRGDAIRRVFGLDQLTILLGDYLAEFPLLLGLFDWLWLAMTLASVLLILLTGRARTLFVSLFVAMHAGMFLTMRLGLFPLISIAALLAFLPPPVWDAVERRVSEPARRRLDGSELRVRLGHANGGRPSTASSAILEAASRWRRRIVPPFVALLLVVVLFWNAASLGYVDTPDAVAATVEPTEYRWDMFAPEPRDNDGWYVVPGALESDRRIDAFRRSELDWDRPPDLARAFPGHRWFVYLLDLRSPASAHLRPAFGEYLCRRWNDEHADDLVGLTVYYVEERVRLDGPEETHVIELHEHECSPDTWSSG